MITIWGLIQKRKGKPRSTCSQILTESGLTRDPSLITEGFSSFYTELYAPLQAWKRTCKQAILKFENAAWNARLHADDDFKRFRQLHTHIQLALRWKCAIDCRSQYHASIVSKLWTPNYEISSTDVLCHRCGMMYKDKYVHAVVVCDEMALLSFYAHVRHTFGNQVYNELRSRSDERR